MAEPIDLTTLVRDPENLNLGTERGGELVESSIAELGAGRSVLVDRNGTIIAGNHAVAAAIKLGLTQGEVIKTTGDRLVVVQREDLDMGNDPRAKKLAILDNRTTDLNLKWDADALDALIDEGTIDLDEAFTTEDLSYLLDGVIPDDLAPDPEELDDEQNYPQDRAIVPIALTWLENKQWQAVKDHLGIQRDKQAFMRLVEDYGAEKMQQP